jgi:putative YphP/YqiW family bacilliredoxin
MMPVVYSSRSARISCESLFREETMYPEMMIAPMREELTSAGIAEARTAADVEQAVQQKGTVMVVVNSVCGCAAGRMRPGVRAALHNSVRPERLITVFAGQDREATDAARRHFTGYPPSSPSIGIFRDGQLVYMMQRSDIEASSPEMITLALTRAFEKHCVKEAISN